MLTDTTSQLTKLSMRDEQVGLLGFPKNSPAYQNRYIYYPDHLVRLPGPSKSGRIASIFSSLYTIFTEPLFKGVLPALIAEPSVECRAMITRDESIGDFISRRYGKAIADNLLSALFHGIYAGDIYKLSARTLLPTLWYLENRDQDGNGINTEMLELLFRQHSLMSYDWVRFHNRYFKDHGLSETAYGFHQMKFSKMAVYTFVNGIQQLSNMLENALRSNPNITIQTSSSVTNLEFEKTNRKFSVRTAAPMEGEMSQYDYVVSSLSPRGLRSILSAPTQPDASSSSNPASLDLLNALDHSPGSVNVMVVSLYYQNPRLAIPPGFGYLIPRSIPVDQNPERALGVIFGSETAGLRGKEAMQMQVMPWHLPNSPFTIEKARRSWVEAAINDKNMSEEDAKAESLKAVKEMPEEVQMGQDTASGTKLTVMMGGHWWSDWPEADLPSPDEAIEMAKSLLARQLKITEQPMLAKARLQKDCIPQYQVGYRDDMARIHHTMLSAFEGRLKVAGTWWQGGVGVNDCVKKARETSTSIREAWDDTTGLEGCTEKEKWILRDGRTGKSVWDPMMKST